MNVSPSYQCRKSHIEREISQKYQTDISWTGEQIPDITYMDPISNIPGAYDSPYSFYKL